MRSGDGDVVFKVNQLTPILLEPLGILRLNGCDFYGIGPVN
jgi:hypothetical protein